MGHEYILHVENPHVWLVLGHFYEKHGLSEEQISEIVEMGDDRETLEEVRQRAIDVLTGKF
jgi:hypothetical protein